MLAIRDVAQPISGHLGPVKDAIQYARDSNIALTRSARCLGGKSNSNAQLATFFMSGG